VRQIKPENRSHIPHFPGSGHLLFLSKIKLGFPETSSQLTPSSSGESRANLTFGGASHRRQAEMLSRAAVELTIFRPSASRFVGSSAFGSAPPT